MSVFYSLGYGYRYANSLYLCGFLCYLINTFLNHTMFTQLSVYSLVKVILFSVVIICLSIKILFLDKLTMKELIVYATLFLLMCLISWKTGDRQLVTLIVVILAAKNVNFKYVLVTFFVTVLLLLTFSYLSTLADWIENLQYTRWRDGEVKIRNSFGAGYPTVFAAYLQALVIAFAYMINVKNIGNHLFLWLLSGICTYISLEFADARMSGYSIILFLFLYYFSLFFLRNIYKHKLLVCLISCSYIVGFFTIFYLSYYYSPDVELFSEINKALSGRLRLGYAAFQEYSIPLLGQQVKFTGLGGDVQEMAENYNYVDSSYLQFMMKYGIVFTLLSMLCFVGITYKRLKLNDYRFVAVIIMISFNSMIEDRLLDISVNVYWILALAYYRSSFHSSLESRKYVENSFGKI